MSRRLHPTLADAVAVAIQPALVMILVGSLVFFLLEIFYHGNYQGRLHYIFALFVFAAVLIARISAEEGFERAAAFALPLAVVTLLALGRFVQYPSATMASFSWLINISLMAAVWWSAHKLTLDATRLEAGEELPEEGLIEAARLKKPARHEAPQPAAGDRGSQDHGAGRQIRTASDRSPAARPHAHGVWVVYFSLAALPLFGVGQLLIAGSQRGRQGYLFALCSAYVLAALGLMLSTSFLGLRSYLRRRRLEMPAGMAIAWIAVGGALVVGLIALSALLPRGEKGGLLAASRSVLTTSPDDLSSSRYGWGDETAQRGDRSGKDAPAGQRSAGDAPASQRSADRSPSAGTEQNGPSRSGEVGSDSKTPAQRSAEAPSDAGVRSDPADREDEGRLREARPSTQRPANSRQDRPADRRPGDRQRAAKQRPAAGDRRDGGTSSQGSAKRMTRPDSPAGPLNPLAALATALGHVLGFLRAAFYVSLVCLALYLAWRQRDDLRAAVRSLWRGLQSLLRRWLGGRGGGESATDSMASEGPRAERPAFVDFDNPFRSGLARQIEPAALVRYSFAALEAWAEDRGLGRGEDETPHEWSQRLVSQVPELRRQVPWLANLYGYVAYAGGRPSAAQLEPLQPLWQQMARFHRVAGPPRAERGEVAYGAQGR